MRPHSHSLTVRYRRAASRRGVALLLVLACLLLLAALILGFLLSGQNNLKSSKLYANGSSVKTLADSTVSLVMAQIQQATSNGTTVAWASQPGMIRTYSSAGLPLTNYRLFSWDSPTVAGTYDPSTDAASITGTATWYSSPAVFFDLNQPTLDAAGALHYPIVDGNPTNLGNTNGTAPVSNYSAPSATTAASTNPVLTYTYNGLTPAIEGFWVNMPNSTTAGAPGPAVNLGTATNTPNYVPMPVKWLYVLQDGTIVVPTLPVGTTVTVTGASATNPIVGRIAYWTDDETAKVNINTASEGNFWDTPRTQGITDFNLATFQPVQNEYQRYPGHPAMTCLSSVFGSLSKVDHTLQASNSYASPAYTAATPATYAPYQFYYDLAPKLNADTAVNLGSQAGTVVWSTSTTAAGSPNTDGYLTPKKGTSSTAGGDRLFDSIDELMFQSTIFNDNAPHNNVATAVGVARPVTTSGGIAMTPTMLDLSKFFITADSRAPDVNLFNQPRVVCWPIGYVPTGGATANYRTTLDQAIAFCGSINNNIYYFQRQRSDHPTSDLPIVAATTGLGRNRMLISYLQNLTSQSIPGFGPGNFNTKYPSGTTPLATTVSERDQILTEIFDYIRCLNLNDTSPGTTTYHPFAPIASTAAPYNCSTTYAGTNGVTSTTGNAGSASAGQGQVIPIYDASTNTKGFGRFPTIQEVSILFFATGWNDGLGGTTSGDINFAGAPWNSGTNIASWTPSVANGFTAAEAAGPFSPYAPWGYYNDSSNGKPVTNPTGPSSTGLAIPGGTPTTPQGNIQVRALLLISFFDPSQGNIWEFNTFRIQAQGLGNFQWGPNSGNLVSMGFPTTGTDTANMVPTSGTEYEVLWGGNLGPRSFMIGNYPFYSTAKNFNYTPPTTVPTFYFQGGDITINLLLPRTTPASSTALPSTWPTDSESASDIPIQQITVSLPSATLPLPTYATPGHPIAVGGGSGIPRVDRGSVSNRMASTASNYAPSAELIAICDTVRSVRAYPGDIRMIAGQVKVTDTTGSANTLGNGYFDSSTTESKMLAAMPNWNYASSTTNLIHGLRSSSDYPFLGAIMGALVPGVSYSGGSGSAYGGNGPPYDQNVPPASGSFGLGNFASAGNNASIKGTFIGGGTTGLAGDWDNGFGYTADGPYINKADEGNLNYGINTPYFGESNYGSAGGLGQTYFSPNRLMPGPGMFGSLPTGVIENIPWRTLLFCANPAGGPTHSGFGTGSGTAGPSDVPPYATNPPDHLWLDLFNMPVVEPYPISEPLSTAGRINMNYQIVPFTYIERSTGVRAVLKSERMTVIPDSLAGSYKTGGGTSFKINTTGNGFGGNYDHRVPIDPDQTLRGFDYYFSNNKDIFRSASQICNMFLYPTRDATGSAANVPKWDSANAGINTFWYGSSTPPGDYSKLSGGAVPTHFLTGDNSRERPYATIYPRLTTKSNTFTVHYCVETLKKVTGSTATTWDESKDQVTGQYRGSTIIERYVDPNDATVNPDGTIGVPDFANSTYYNTALDKWYKFRVVSTKEFAP